jgi:hypothetical protein
MYPRLTLLTVAAAVALVGGPNSLRAQDRPYTEGSVWDLTLVHTTEGMADDYLRSLASTWKPIMEEARKQHLILSYQILSSNAVGAQDWDIMLMVEYKNWAAFDGLAAKFDPIEQRIVGGTDANRELMTKRLEIRRFVGSKTAQTLLLK